MPHRLKSGRRSQPKPVRKAGRLLTPTLIYGLLGYFYLPHRDSKGAGTGLEYAPAQNPDGVGWVQKKKFAQQFKFAPIMSDMLQFNSSVTSWNYYSSHPGKKNFPDGGNFLFEDGHVRWYMWGDVQVGAISLGSPGVGWECRYKVDTNW